MVMRDAQEQETSRSMLRGSESLEVGHGKDSFYVRGRNQSSVLESRHGSGSGSEDREKSRWEKYLPR
jgi:hypothetical protein